MALGSVVIVGAGRNLGAALARTFATVGHPVALIARDGGHADSIAARLREDGHDARGYAADAADPASLRTTLATALHDLGAPDVLIYNAALLRQDTPTDGDAAGWATAMAVDVLGAKVATEAVLGRFRGGRGSLLFTGGGLALHPSPTYASVSVGKAALRAYVATLHAQLDGSELHATVVTIAGTIGVDQGHFAPATIAAAYLDLHRQPRRDWCAELLWE